MHSGSGIDIDGAVLWIFGNDHARNFTTFGVDNSLSSPSDNFKNNFLILDEGPTFDINGSFGTPEETFSNTFVLQKQNFAWVYITIIIIVICLWIKNKFISEGC